MHNLWKAKSKFRHMDWIEILNKTKTVKRSIALRGFQVLITHMVSLCLSTNFIQWFVWNCPPQPRSCFIMVPVGQNVEISFRRKVKGLLDYLNIFSWFIGKSWWICVNCSYANLFRDWTVSHSVAVKPLFLQIFSKIMVRRAANNKGIIRLSQTRICPS